MIVTVFGRRRIVQVLAVLEKYMPKIFVDVLGREHTLNNCILYLVGQRWHKRDFKEAFWMASIN